MNKVLFNSGGQPVYLDDLQIIQDEVREAAEEIISSLGVDLDQEVFYVKKPTMTLDGSLATFSNGVLWHKDYGLIPINGVSNLNVSLAQTYVRIMVTDSNNRTFEDGQQYACKQTVVANIVNIQSGICYLFSEIQDMMSKLSTLLHNSDSKRWIPLNVFFYNGYSGKVEYREYPDYYQYHIDISSNNTEFGISGSLLFEVGADGWPGGSRNSVSCLFGTGGDDVAYASYVAFVDGMARIFPLRSDVEGASIWTPADCPVNIIFEIAK